MTLLLNCNVTTPEKPECKFPSINCIHRRELGTSSQIYDIISCTHKPHRSQPLTVTPSISIYPRSFDSHQVPSPMRLPGTLDSTLHFCTSSITFHLLLQLANIQGVPFFDDHTPAIGLTQSLHPQPLPSLLPYGLWF